MEQVVYQADQSVLVYRIEEFPQVDVDDPVIPVVHELEAFQYRLFTSPVLPEPV